MFNLKIDSLSRPVHHWFFIAVVFALFFSLSFFGHALRMVDYFNAIPGDLVDPRLNSIFLEHVYGWVMGRWQSLWSPLFFYPFENALAFSDNHLGSVGVYILFRWLGFNRELAMISWYVFGCAANFIAAYWVMRRFTFSALAASVGAFIFASALPVLGEPDHAQLVYRFAIPLAFLFFWRYLEGAKPLSLAIAALWLSWQFYCSIYLGLLLCFLLIATLLAYWILPNSSHFHLGLIGKHVTAWRQTNRLKRFMAILGLLVSAIAIAALLWKYRQVAQAYGYAWDKAEILSLLPRFTSYLIADRSTLSAFVGSWVKDIAWRNPHQLFIGLGVVILFIPGLYFIWLGNSALPKSLTHLGRVSSFALLMLLLGTVSVFNHSLYEIALYFPGISGIRVVSRIILPMLLPIAFIVGITTEVLNHKITNTSALVKMGITVFLAILVSAETLTSTIPKATVHDWQLRTESLRLLLPSLRPANAILFTNPNAAEWNHLAELDSMILAQDLGIPTLNGFSGQSPPGKVYREPDRCFSYVDRLSAYAQFAKPNTQALDRITSAQIIELRADQKRPTSAMPTPSLQLGEVIDFSTKTTDQNRPVVQICGWSYPEPWGIWSTRGIAKMVLPLPRPVTPIDPPKPMELSITAKSLGTKLKPEQMIQIWLNGFFQKNVMLGNNPAVINLTIPSADLGQKYVLLEFRLPDRVKPKDVGLGNDEREEGIGLISAVYQ